MSIQAGLNISELPKSSFWTRPLVWHAVLAAAVFIAIAALIAAQTRPEAIDDLAGIAIPF
jgi:hypothetical protein